jgi:5-methyltetrahydropteroyltriglutamate--homocysteine methyltransferase
LHEEYRAVVDAGFVLQIDDPRTSRLVWDMLKPEPTVEAYRKFARLRIDAVTMRSPASPRSGCATICAGAAGTGAYPRPAARAHHRSDPPGEGTDLIPSAAADRILRYAAIVGRGNVLAGTDSGLGGRVHADLAWAKLRTLVEGARLASQSLWA